MWRKYKKYMIPLLIVLIFVIPIMINFSFQDHGWFEVQWSAKDVLLFYGSVLALLGSLFVGGVALYQNMQLHKINEKMQKMQEEQLLAHFAPSPVIESMSIELLPKRGHILVNNIHQMLFASGLEIESIPDKNTFFSFDVVFALKCLSSAVPHKIYAESAFLFFEKHVIRLQRHHKLIGSAFVARVDENIIKVPLQMFVTDADWRELKELVENQKELTFFLDLSLLLLGANHATSKCLLRVRFSDMTVSSKEGNTLMNVDSFSSKMLFVKEQFMCEDESILETREEKNKKNRGKKSDI